MWVSYFNNYYWSMCETMNGKYKDYHIKIFPFLADQAGNVETIYFYGYSVPRRFVHLTKRQKNRLKIYKLLNTLNNN